MRVTDKLLGLAFLTAVSAPLGAAEAQVSPVGTWAARVTTAADLTVPVFGAAPANVDLTLRLDVVQEGAELVAHASLCSLSTTSDALAVDYSKVLPYLTDSVGLPAVALTPGSKFPLPDIVIRLGLDEAGNAFDVDGDNNPGATLPAKVLGLVDLAAYTTITIDFKLDATLVDENTISGAGSFGSVGSILGSNNPLVSNGPLNVTQKAPAILTAKRFADGATCAELLPQL